MLKKGRHFSEHVCSEIATMTAHGGCFKRFRECRLGCQLLHRAGPAGPGEELVPHSTVFQGFSLVCEILQADS